MSALTITLGGNRLLLWNGNIGSTCEGGLTRLNSAVRGKIEKFVKENIGQFHQTRIKNLNDLKLRELLLKKNPYLFRAKNLNSAAALIGAVLEARLSSGEEGSFGGFLEALALYVAEVTSGAQKSPAEGLDIDLKKGNSRYLIAVKSGNNWGNSSQHRQLQANFKTAVKILKQSKYVGDIQPTLGICYGRFATKHTGLYLHIGGQNFWNLISGDASLYVDIVEPLGFEAEKHNKAFDEEKDKTANRLVREFTNMYCDSSGAINWEKLVSFVSGNLVAHSEAVSNSQKPKKQR